MDARPAEVGAGLGAFDPWHAFDWEVGGWDAELKGFAQRDSLCVGEFGEGGVDGVHTSLEPRPKPDTTLPFIRRGNGGSGPLSGPMIFGRGPSGRIVGIFSSGFHLGNPRFYFCIS